MHGCTWNMYSAHYTRPGSISRANLGFQDYNFYSNPESQETDQQTFGQGLGQFEYRHLFIALIFI